jgi:hypothetical protein
MSRLQVLQRRQRSAVVLTLGILRASLAPE